MARLNSGSESSAIDDADEDDDEEEDAAESFIRWLISKLIKDGYHMQEILTLNLPFYIEAMAYAKEQREEDTYKSAYLI